MFSETNNNSIINLIEEKHLLQQRVSLLEFWVESLIEHNSLNEFCIINNIKNVAIYPYGKYGKLLERMLLDTDTRLHYVIDKNKKAVRSLVPIFSLEDELPLVDAIIISTIGFDTNQVIKQVQAKNSQIKVFSIIDIFQCQNILN